MMRVLIQVALLAMLAGCAAPGGGLMNTNTYNDSGAMPKSYEAAIQQYLNYSLKDPGSLREFSTGRPERSSCAVGIYGSFHGWRVPAQYNAKNSFGGYVGLRRTYFWFHGERLKGVGDNPGFCPEAPAWR